ncbi:MAG TPA: hypothetical protein DCP28_01255, partial [Cytophagales bacterium]|nr:hypothetical protein [Cytophagales bacterium]
DLLLLKKLPEGWKIVAKATSAEPLPKTPQEWDSRPVQETVLWDLKKPWSMVFLSEEEALIAEKDGTILLVNLTTNSRTPLEGLPTDVGRAKEIDTLKYPGEFHPNLHGMTQSFNAGWFQLLLHPDFENEPYLYISYVAEDEERASALKVIRGKLEGNQLSDVETLLLAGPFTHGLFHYGGGMVFGRDGKLYISTGERNFYEYNNPPLPTAQNLADPRGKVFRLNPDGSIPKDNPDFGPEAVPGLYGLGIRAAQGLALHPATGDIWMSEHGTHQGDELNVLQGGGNYGWPYRTTGRYRTDDYDPQEPEGLEYVDPVHVWNQTVAPTGLAFYTGREFPQWQGDLLVPGLSQGNLWRIRLEGSTVVGQEELFVDQRTRLRKVILSPRGVLYLLTDEEEGRLIRVVNKNF